ncbi:peptide/nickel transport system permease protein [Pseudomonas sp. NFIX10]|uniref:ABC transporter permease n=1 Tax=unclassified Pseudomonas TaxID=196821 RepID=UPI0008EF3B4D|nr:MULTISPECIES: ABC transporter permease [unclassified Pseudomonas]SFB02234.1 peptide/nickel transport system permease protein [Pseudomonas sp. NFIX10]SFE56675.1 peptide/nickel transport system permease protein [Pseudomonas sp. NFACC06-1]
MSHEAAIQSNSPAMHALPRVIGFSILASLILFAVLVPLIWGESSVEMDRTALLSGPMHGHPLGTDELGRDMLARLAAAVGLSLGFAVLSVITAAVPGILLGILAGWTGGVMDKCLSLLAKVLLVLPRLLLVLLIVVIFPGNLLAVYGAIALVLWTEYFSMTRALSRTALASPAGADSRQQGHGPLYVIRRHVWPELSSRLMTFSASGAASAILALATLSYLGVGVSPPTAEPGLMIAQLMPYSVAAPFSFALPVFVIFLTVLSLLIIGSGRRP